MESEAFTTAQRYADIIDLPHHVSKRHPQMPLASRAAQFAPFSAVTGHDAAFASPLHDPDAAYL